MTAYEFRPQSREPSEIRMLGCASKKRTKEAADWIYAGELTAQLGAHAACVVGHHIQRLSGTDDDEAMCTWIATFNKVGTLLRGSAADSRH